MGDLRIRLFGQLRAHDGDRLLGELGSQHDQALWAFLLLNTDEAHSRTRLAYRFWPDTTDTAARNRLRHALYVIRRALPEAPADQPWFLGQHDTVQWNVNAPASVDVHEFRRILTPLTPGAGRNADAAPLTVEAVEAAVALYRGDLLESYYDEVFLEAREQLRLLYFAALEWLIAAYEARGNGPRAIATATTLLTRDPLREESYRVLMNLHSRLGDRASALRQFEACREILQRELGVQPSAETLALYERLLRNDMPAMPSSRQPGRKVRGERRLTRPATPLVGVAPLVGRRTELALLQQFWQQAVAGDGALVMVAGEAGMGKTRLLAELTDTAAEADTVLYGRARETETLTPYLPVVEAFRGYLDEAGSGLPDALAQLDPVWLAELGRLLPEIRTMRTGLPEPATLDPALDRLRLFEGLTRCILAIAETPAILVLDDLHWADEATLAWLDHFSRRLPGAKLLIAGAYRADELTPQLVGLRRRLTRDGWRGEVVLGQLVNSDLAHLLRELSGSSEVVSELSFRLTRDTGGNPLFVLETLREMLETGILRRDDEGWHIEEPISDGHDSAKLPLPRTVREVIGGRLSRLSDQARQVAGAAAVVGREFDIDLVWRVSGHGEDEVLDALDELLEAQIVVESGPSPVAAGRGVAGAPAMEYIGYAFSHDKVQEVVYSDLSAARRVRMHARCGDALAARYAEFPAMIAAQLGRHYREALRPAEAAKYWALAAETAMRGYAYREACTAYLEAIACLDGMLVTDDLRRQRTLVRLQLTQAAFYVQPGRLIEWLAPAEVDARALGDPILQAQVTMAQASGWYIRGDFNKAVATLEPLLALAKQAGNDALVLRVENLLGRIEVLRGESRRGRERLLAAAARMTGVASESEVLVSLDMAAAALSVLGDFDEAEAESQRILDRAEEMGDPTTIAMALVFLEAIHQHREEWDRTVEFGRAAISRAREAGNLIYEYDAYLFAGLGLAYLGDIAGAIDMQENALQIAEQAHLQLLLGRCSIWLAEIYLLAGRLDDAREAANTGLTLATQQGSAIEQGLAERILGEIAIAACMPDDAAERLAAAEQIFIQLEAEAEIARTIEAQAQVARLRGDQALALRLQTDAARRLTALGIHRKGSAHRLTVQGLQ